MRSVFFDRTLPSPVDGRPLPSVDASAPIPEDTIGGVYRVTGKLGSGAMGFVLSAVDEPLDRPVAIKFIHPTLLDPQFRERFQNEARAMARVQHPNVVRIYTFGEHEAAPYFVMEYIEGSTLEDWLGDNPVPDLDVAFRIIEDLCRGVSAIHEASTVHRDLKPSNVLLDARLSPKVADLGLAVLPREDGSSQHEVVGTPAYMAPEVAAALEVDETMHVRADVYSLACVAYELLTGRAPFEGENHVTMLVQHATAPVPPPSTFRPELGPAIDAAMLHALEKEPADRTASVEAFRHALVLGREGAAEPLRILVAEDDDDFRDLLERGLRAEFPDAEVEAVRNGGDAIVAFERARPSVCILDLEMPGLSGIDVTEALRMRDAERAVPIIVLTGSGGPGEWKRLADLGADRFLVKPVVMDDVVVLVRRLLGDRQSLTPSGRIPSARRS